MIPQTDDAKAIEAECRVGAAPRSARELLYHCYDIPWEVLDYLSDEDAASALRDLTTGPDEQ